MAEQKPNNYCWQKKDFETSEAAMWGHIYYNKKKEVQTGLVSGAQKTGPNGVWNSNVDGQPQIFLKKVQMG